jgi:hypothetical protein
VRRANLSLLAWVAVLVCASSLTSCARRPSVGELDLASRRQRFEIALARRAEATGCEADLLAWARVRGWREMPGLQARVLIGAPDVVRIRVGSWFGTAIDLSARGDSVTAHLPSRRLAFETAHANESLGVARPGDLGYRILSGVWTPPAGGWERSTAQDSLVVLSWEEEGAFLRMAVGTSGLPAWVERRTAADTLRVSYAAWRAWSDVRWPSRLDVRDLSGAFDVQCRLEGLRFRSDVRRSSFAIAVPAGTEWFDIEALREAFAEGGGS